MDESPFLPQRVEAEHTRLSIPSRLDWIEPTIEYLKQKAILSGACSPERSYRLELAFHEALTNAIVHGNFELSSALKETEGAEFAAALARRSADPRFARREVQIVIDFDGARCCWSITDEGTGFDVERVLQQNADADAAEEGLLASGRGIVMMLSLLDEVHFGHGGRQINLVLHETSGQERRRHGRVAHLEEVRLFPRASDGSVDWDAGYSAFSSNVSAGGMAVVQAPLGNIKRIILELQAGDEPIYIPAEVCHLEPIGAEMARMGVRFEDRPFDRREADAARDQRAELGAVIDALLEDHASKRVAPDERREHERVVYTARITIRPAGGGELQAAFARDLSKGGVAFIATDPLVVGRSIDVLLPAPAGPMPWIRSQVIRCEPIIEGFFDVGARFLGWAPRQLSSAS